MEFLRRRLGLILRSLVSLAFVAYLLHMHIDWPLVWQDVKRMDFRWLVLAVSIFIPILSIVSWRWKILLAAHDLDFRFWRLLELNMIGQFFSAFLIGTTGGDVVKIFYVSRAVPQQKAAVAFTVVVDRVIGMIAMLILGAGFSWMVLPLLFSTAATRATTSTFYFFVLAGLLFGLVAALGPLLLRNPYISSLAEKLPIIHRRSALFAAYERTASRMGTNFAALLLSVPSHLSTIGVGFCILRAMHLKPDWIAFSAIILIVNMLIALPVSISGVGVREQLFIRYLGLLAISRDQAVTLSLTFFLITLFWSLVGGAFYALYRHETHAPAPNGEEPELEPENSAELLVTQPAAQGREQTR